MSLAALYRETPGALPAALGFGIALFSYEADTMTSVNAMAEVKVAVYGFLATAALLVLVGYMYHRSPSLRISRFDATITVLAVMTSSCMILRAIGVADGSYGLSVMFFTGRLLGSQLIIVNWCENIIRLGSQRVGLLFALSTFVYAACSGISMLLNADVAGIFVGLTPLVSVGLLIGFKRHVVGAKNVSGEFVRTGERQTVSQNSLMLLHKNQAAGSKLNAMLWATALATIFLLRFGFCFAVDRWIPLQDAGVVSHWGQLSGLIGSALAAAFLLLLVLSCWNQSTILLIEFFALFALMTLLLLLLGFNEAFSLCGLGIVSYGTKLALLLTLLCPFLIDAKNPPEVLCVSFTANMVSLGAYSILSNVVSLEWLYILAAVAVGLLTSLLLGLFILIEGNHTESAGVTVDRLNQSLFNATEAWLREENLGQHAGRCAQIAIRCELTQRETEVLLLLAERYNAKEIADMLVISEATVKTHIRKIYTKLGVHSQREAIKIIES